MRLLVLALCLAATACFPRKKPAYEIKLVNGKVIPDTVAPGAIQISSPLPPRPEDPPNTTSHASCTATWVSQNTVMTAAHCITDDNGQALKLVEVEHGMGTGLKTTQIFVNENYNPRSAAFDVALLKFQDNAVAEKSAAHMPSAAPQQGNPISIVGYGKFIHADPNSGGMRRGGTNKVVSVDATINFEGSVMPKTGEGTGEDVLNSQGDSGGPMFLGSLDEQQIIGVSSTVDAANAARLTGHYTNLFHPNNFGWLKKMVASGQARILGIEGATPMDNAGQATIPPSNNQGQNQGQGQPPGGLGGGGSGMGGGGGNGGKPNWVGYGDTFGTGKITCQRVQDTCMVACNGQKLAWGVVPEDDPECKSVCDGPLKETESLCH